MGERAGICGMRNGASGANDIAGTAARVAVSEGGTRANQSRRTREACLASASPSRHRRADKVDSSVNEQLTR